MMSSVRPRLSHETLTWARVSSGFEAEDIARSAGVTLERYGDWESGEGQPTFRQLRQLANKMKRPLALFYLKKPPVEPDLPRDFRVLASGKAMYAPDLRLELRRAGRTQLIASSLLEELGMSFDAAFPSGSPEGDSEDLGQQLRNLLQFPVDKQVGIGNAADLYRIWRDAIFDHGVLSLQFGLDRNQALGFALWHDIVPIVAVNTRQVPEAKTFTLLHELAHVALRMPGVSDAAIPFQATEPSQSANIEDFCNRVAAAVLLPRSSSEVQEAIDAVVRRDLDLNTVRLHARRFGVSKYALAYRLSALRPERRNLVQQSISKWFAIDNSGSSERKTSKGGPTPALTALGRKGRAFSRRVLLAVKESRLSVDDARDLLDLEPHHFPKLEEHVFNAEHEEEDID